MNIRMIAATAAFAAALTLGVAQDGKAKRPEGGKGGKGGDPAQRAEMMIKRLDKDGDGKLSKEEFAAGPMAERFKDEPERLDRVFGALDKDGDGKLSKEELAAAPRGDGKGRPGDGKGKGPNGEGEGKGKGPKGGEQ
jgi:hypothetical protein